MQRLDHSKCGRLFPRYAAAALAVMSAWALAFQSAGDDPRLGGVSVGSSEVHGYTLAFVIVLCVSSAIVALAPRAWLLRGAARAALCLALGINAVYALLGGSIACAVYLAAVFLFLRDRSDD